MTSNALINQIAAIILDTHSHLYTKEEAFDKITATLKQQDGAIRFKQPQYKCQLLTYADGRQLEQELNDFLNHLKDQGYELDDLTYQSHVCTDADGEMKQEHSAMVLYKVLS